jgi:hypothetical protein
MAHASAYRDNEGKPVICTSVCVLADILGFSARILSCASVGESTDLCRRVERLLAERREELDGFPKIDPTWPNLGPVYQIFSDTLVLACPIRPPGDWGEPELAEVLSYLERYQCILALKGFFLRGAMTCGELHISSELCFGKSLVEAYYLERDQANMPRIILSPFVQKLVRHHLTFYAAPSCSPHASSFLVDEDGELFMNYLDAVNYGEFGSDLSMIEEHRNQVVKNLDHCSEDNDVRAKYAWLRDYHNFFCEHYIHGCEEYWPSADRVAQLKIQVADGPARTFRRLSDDDAQGLSE